MAEINIELKLSDICDELGLGEEVCVELVNLGIVNPEGNKPAEWSFDLTMVSLVRRAVRLHQELELDWSSVAMVIQLVEERDQLRSENEVLRQRLERFLNTNLPS